MIYDYIIIGGGIAGLYANYLLQNKGYNGILLEKNKNFGGRVGEGLFHDFTIKYGAGIFTPDNKHLIKLLDQLKMKYTKSSSSITSLLDNKFDIDIATKYIKKIYNRLKKEKNKDIDNLTVKLFLEKYCGKEFTKEYIKNCHYMDFLESDVNYYIKYYKIEDMTHKETTVYRFKWSDLVDKLVLANCFADCEVTNIKYSDCFIINNELLCEKIILATTIKSIDKLIGKFNNFKYSNYIGSVPFARIYTYHEKEYDGSKIGGFSLVKNELHKMIKINKNILMASYCDNKNALFWKRIFENKKLKKTLVDKLKELDVNINSLDDYKFIYWNDGVHYYKPMRGIPFNNLLRQLSNPHKDIYVIGEVVSKKDGYVEGAIESVLRMIKHF